VAIDDRRPQVSFTATVTTRGIVGPLMALAMRAQLGRESVRGLDDLRHFVEHGKPSPRNQRQLDRALRSRRTAQARRAMPTFEATRVVAASRDRVWEIIGNVAGLAARAPNLSATEVVEGDGEGMVRRCYNHAGKGWSETCTVWEPGHRCTMEVANPGDPYPLHEMRGTWAVEDDPGGTRISRALGLQAEIRVCRPPAQHADATGVRAHLRKDARQLRGGARPAGETGPTRPRR
jgi:uncharacterized protein YndB with AHSA1/START domain